MWRADFEKELDFLLKEVYINCKFIFRKKCELLMGVGRTKLVWVE